MKTRMKKIQYILLTAGLVALAAACEKQPAGSEPAADERVTTISASIEGSGTKVSIADADGKFSWSAGDKIIVHTTSGYVLSDALTAGGTTADFKFTMYTLYDGISLLSIREIMRLLTGRTMAIRS